MLEESWRHATHSGAFEPAMWAVLAEPRHPSGRHSLHGSAVAPEDVIPRFPRRERGARVAVLPATQPAVPTSAGVSAAASTTWTALATRQHSTDHLRRSAARRRSTHMRARSRGPGRSEPRPSWSGPTANDAARTHHSTPTAREQWHAAAMVAGPHPVPLPRGEGLCGARQCFVQRSSQPMTVSCQSMLLAGVSTQWFSSGK